MIKEFLETFNMVTKFFFGVYYPTTFMTINHNFAPIVAPMELKFKKIFWKN